MAYPCELRVDLSALKHNYDLVKRRLSGATGVMAMLKGDAYGHGAVELAKFYAAQGVSCIGVAHVKGARSLRAAGVMTRILVLQPDYHFDQESYAELNLECCLNGIEDLDCWQNGRRVRAHLFVDSGMGREGALPEEAKLCMQRLQTHPVLEWRGLATHFATADMEDLSFAFHQLDVFKNVVADVPAQIRQKLDIHAANSGAILNLPESHFNLVRPGILLYGQYNGKGRPDQKAAMSVVGRLSLVKRVQRGQFVGYGLQYRAERDTRLGIVAMGYADGFLRQKLDDARVWIHDKPYPVVGCVSMDSVVIDLGPHDEIRLGDLVVFFDGLNPERSILRDAECHGTIAYERCCQLGLRLPKVYY